MPFDVQQNPHLINPNISQYMQNKVDGIQARALALKRITKLASLRATGIAKPATVLNFNPVCLRMEGGITAKVPSVVDPCVFPDDRLEYEYKGAKYQASVFTIRDPILYPWIRDVQKSPEQDMADGIGVYDIEVCKQIEIAHCFWTVYNTGAHDSSGMGGVLIFEGDRHALRSEIIQVPTFITLPNGNREYITEPRNFIQELITCLDTQRTYYENQMQIAQSYSDDPDQKKNITTVMRVWAQFGLDMHFREKAPEWLLARDEAKDACEGCGSAKKRALAHFCHACNRPYDPFRSYMEKEITWDSVHMQRIADDQWPLVLAEEARRKALRTPPPEPEVKAKK